MRVVIVLLIGLVWIPSVKVADSWTAWLYDIFRGSIVLIDEQGNELEAVILPVKADQGIVNIGVAHNGHLIAYVSANSSLHEGQMRVYDTQSKQLRLEYELPNNGDMSLTSILRYSNNFSPDDKAFAFGLKNATEDGWRILVFDLESGKVSYILTADNLPTRLQITFGEQPFIFQFANDTITFNFFNFIRAYPDRKASLQWSIDWYLPTDSLSENCFYKKTNSSLFEPTGEVIEAETHPDLGYIPDTNLETSGQYTLEFYNPKTQWRQVFYQNRDFLPSNQVFVQNGERVVLWGTPNPLKPGMTRLILIDRDGNLIDQFDIEGMPSVQSTNDGFIYTTVLDVSGWITKLIYVNTRVENPFMHQSVIFEGNPGALLGALWAKSQNTLPLADFIPWGNRIEYYADCPPHRG